MNCKDIKQKKLNYIYDRQFTMT